MNQMMGEALQEAERLRRSEQQAEQYARYRQDPVGFGEEILGERFTPDVVDVINSVRDNPVTVARSATDVGKTHGAARVAIWFYKVYHEAQVYLTAAPPLENLRRLLWGEVMSVVDRNAALFQDDYIKALGIFRDSLSFVTCVAIPTSGTPEVREAKFSGKHAPQLLFIVDEGDAVPDEVFRGIEGCLSGGLVPRLLVMFNPRAPMGPVYEMEENHQANVVELSALKHPNVVTGKNLIPGAVTRDATLRRINEWTMPAHPDEVIDSTCFLVPDFLVGTTTQALNGKYYPPLPPGHRKIKESSFYYMVLGVYPPQGATQLISPEDIKDARARWDAYVAQHGQIPPVGVRPVMGLDVAERGGDWNVAALRYGGYVAPFEVWQGMDVDWTTSKALELYRQYHVDIAQVDGIGIGSSIAPAMARRGKQDDVRAVTVKVSERPTAVIKTELGEFKQLRDQLWWAMREWLRTDKGAMLPPDRLLLEELSVPTWEIKPQDGKIRVTHKDDMRAALKRSPDRAEALMMTFNPVRRATILSVDYPRHALNERLSGRPRIG